MENSQQTNEQLDLFGKPVDRDRLNQKISISQETVENLGQEERKTPLYNQPIFPQMVSYIIETAR